jgi:hypothetical protein
MEASGPQRELERALKRRRSEEEEAEEGAAAEEEFASPANVLQYALELQEKIVRECMREQGASLDVAPCPRLGEVSTALKAALDDWIGRTGRQLLAGWPRGAPTLAQALLFVSPRFKLVSRMRWPVADATLEAYAAALMRRRAAETPESDRDTEAYALAVVRRRGKRWKLFLVESLERDDAGWSAVGAMSHRPDVEKTFSFAPSAGGGTVASWLSLDMDALLYGAIRAKWDYGETEPDAEEKSRSEFADALGAFFHSSSARAEGAPSEPLSAPSPEMLRWKREVFAIRVKVFEKELSPDEERFVGAREAWLQRPEWGYRMSAAIDSRPQSEGEAATGVLFLPAPWAFVARWGVYSTLMRFRTRWGVFSARGPPLLFRNDSKFVLAHQPHEAVFLRDDAPTGAVEELAMLQAPELGGKPLLRRARGRVASL